MTSERSREPAPPTRLFSGSLIRTRTKRSIAFSDTLRAPIQEVAVPPKTARAAFYLALAHRWEAEIAAGIYRDRADIARTFRLTRARVTQILDMALLAPDIQEQVIVDVGLEGKKSITVRKLLPVAHCLDWREQRAVLAKVQASGLM